MRMIHVPRPLRFLAWALLLGAPFAALETITLSRVPWWETPVRPILTWSLAVFCVCLPLAMWILRLRRWAFSVASAFFGTWVFLSAWVSIRMRHPGAGFFTVLLALVFGFILFRLGRELNRSFLNPELVWYQGLPKPIPGLQCEVDLIGDPMKVQVSRLDTDGVFVFSSKPLSEERVDLMPPLLEKENFELRFRFREREVQLQGLPVALLGRGLGAGIQFKELTLDKRKELGDLLESLRGEGYVQ